VTTATPGRKSTRSPMSVAELAARADARAHAERVHIFAVPGRAGVYTTKSTCDPTERYSLVAPAGIVACSCRGYEYRGSCKHSAALLNRLARVRPRSWSRGSPRASGATIRASTC
jgi:hypothetical protein